MIEYEYVALLEEIKELMWLSGIANSFRIDVKPTHERTNNIDAKL